MSTDFADWQAPQAHATAISDTGVPLLTGSVSLVNTSKTIAASGNVSLGPFAVTQIGYEIIAGCIMANAATNPFVTIVLSWVDTGSGDEVATDSFSTICGAASLSALPTAIRGPSKANQLGITIYNNDTVQSATVNIVALQNSRIYSRDEMFWVNQYPNTLLVPALTLATQAPDESVLGVLTSQTVAASTSKNWQIAPAPGKLVYVTGNTAGATASSIVVTCFAMPQSLYGAGAVLLRQPLSIASFGFSYIGPRCSVQLQFTNNATTTATISCVAVAQTT